MGNWAGGMSTFTDLLDILCIVFHKNLLDGEVNLCYMLPQNAIKFDYLTFLCTGIQAMLVYGSFLNKLNFFSKLNDRMN